MDESIEEKDDIKEDVVIDIGDVELAGQLSIPPEAKGIVVFVHGSGSSRLSPRNRRVAGRLNRAGLATLLFDLLSAREEGLDMETARLRFDIKLLTQRVLQVVIWLRSYAKTEYLQIGLFGASTGAAAALAAASRLPVYIKAVVSRGGRPDLAADILGAVRSPTLLIVGEKDMHVLELNRRAWRMLPWTVAKELQIIPGATHLFEEPGAMELVADFACQWYTRFLRGKGNA